MRIRGGLIAATALVALSTSGCWFQAGAYGTRTAYVTGETGLTSANASTLHQVWVKSVGTQPASSPVIDAGRLFVSSGSLETALATNNGSQVWQANLAGGPLFNPSLGAPSILNGQVAAPYFAGNYGGVYTFDETNGASTYTSALIAEYNPAAAAGGTTAWTIGGYDGTHVIAAVRYGTRSGLVYSASIQNAGMGSTAPMLNGNFVYTSATTKVYSFALDTCPSSPLASYCGATWTTDLGSTAGMPVAVGASQIAVPLANGNVAVLDGTTGQLQWTAVTGSTAAQPPAIDDTNIYVGTADGKVRAFPVAGCGNATCNATWSSNAAGTAISSQPVVAGGVVYVGTQGGKLAGYATSNGASLYSTTVDAAATTVNVIEDGSTVYVTTSTGKVAAYRTP